MKKYLINLLLLSSAITQQLLAQQLPSTLAARTEEAPSKDAFGKKFYYGLSWNQYWGNIRGNDLPETYFTKPCIGYGLHLQYYPVSFMGISVAGGFQQRGAGIITPDKSGGSFTHPWESPTGDPDSTYRRRLRYNAMELPVTLILRTPKDIIKGVRPSISAGLSIVRARKVHDFFASPEDGFHTDEVVNANYIRKDIATQYSIGADIDAGGGAVMQVHLVYTKGIRNVYAAGQGDGKMQTIGFRVSWLF